MSRSQSVIFIPIAVGIACGLVLAGCSAGSPAAADPATISAAAPRAAAAPPAAAELAVPAAGIDSIPAAAIAQPAAAAPVAVSTQAATAGSDLNLITAQGIGKVSGTPDVVTIGLGVQTTSTSAQSALDENNKLATDAIAVLKDNGVAPEDLQTSQLSVYPTYGDQGQITGYQVSNMVTAKLRDISKSGAVIDAVGKSAGNAIRVQQLSFAIDDDSAPRAAARADAVKRAQAQAKQLADAAGVALGPVHSITEIGAQNTPYYPMMDAAAGTAAAQATPPIEAGSLELTVTVQVVYEIAQ
jgi:uncharacterized protein